MPICVSRCACITADRELLLQAMSHGLTQYDVEELVESCGGKCMSHGTSIHHAVAACALANLISGVWCSEFCCLLPTVTQGEIEVLYKRFRALDRGHKVGL